MNQHSLHQHNCKAITAMSRARELMPFSVKQLEGVLIIKSAIITAALAKISCYINNPLSPCF